MSGHCYSCASSFGTFNKELGCKNCGFAFCKKCLSKKVEVPQQNNAKLAVCNQCYNILTGKIPAPTKPTFEAPDAYYKRLAALEASKQNQGPAPTRAARPAAAKPSTAVAPATRRVDDKYKGLSPEDLAMAQRLERLKEDTKPVNVPTQTEIEARLERLKQVPEDSANAACTDDDIAGRLARVRGQDPAARANQPFVFRSDRRTQQEQIDALLDEINDEIEIDSRHVGMDPVTDIQDRLNKLKSDTNSQNSTNDIGRADGNHGSRSVQMNGLNIPPANREISPVNREAFDRPNEPSLSDIERLMHEVANEMHIDAERAIEGLKKDKDLWNRVQRLKNERKKDLTDNNRTAMNVDGDELSSDSEDDETATKRVLQQLMEESRLDEASGFVEMPSPASSSKKSRALPSPPSSNKPRTGKPHRSSTAAAAAAAAGGGEKCDAADEDELPWCCICNNDATLRCIGCDGDLYCPRCYREGHDRYEMQEHRTVKYTAPKTSSSR